jgi:integrase
MTKKQPITIQDNESLATASIAFENAIRSWADATTSIESARRHDLLREKTKAVTAFFCFVTKSPESVVPGDVKRWQKELERQGLAASTIYSMISKVSSFYKWLLQDPMMSSVIINNPVTLARPKAPKPYQTVSTKSLSDKEVADLFCVIKEKAAAGNIVAKRDLALLIHFIATGRRRQEVLSLRWGDIRLVDVMIVTYKVKGGRFETRIIRDPAVKAAMLDYLEASDRLKTIQAEDSIWTRHDRAGMSGNALTSHSFSKNIKRYALKAGIGDVHLHQLRHTFARLAGDLSGSVGEVSEALGHRAQSTTRLYLDRVGVKRDNFSTNIVQRLDLGD